MSIWLGEKRILASGTHRLKRLPEAPSFAAFFKADCERWSPIVETSGYKAYE